MSTKRITVKAQAAKVRELLLADKSESSFDDKLKAIADSDSSLAAGVKAVQREGENPKPAGSGSAAHEPLRLSDFV